MKHSFKRVYLLDCPHLVKVWMSRKSLDIGERRTRVVLMPVEDPEDLPAVEASIAARTRTGDVGVEGRGGQPALAERKRREDWVSDSSREQPPIHVADKHGGIQLRWEAAHGSRTWAE